ncbi:tetratricopeptide repeat protein [Curvibacter sp. HBC61]|uniref:Tetratricopeptide repeat protein n=1 Tax=Curvibacter cyanobacteriorum TaxID=3026422 RepID=A0ABT5MT07_9BURK|nr:tetratricopeptide repeat protein [Curvibacter sp. HBC61]MDD0837160.1 tetratricopeptide repeat protein [Curvibacter sp. HBC61]
MRMPVMLGAALVALACGIPAAGQSPSAVAVTPELKGRLDALIADGSYNDALALIEKVERQGALPPDMQLKRGIVLMQLGDTDEARKVFERLRDAYPQQVAPYVNLAAIHARNDDLESAREALTRATAVAPQQASHHESLGRIHLGLAWKSFKLAAELDPNRQALLRKNQAIEALIRDSANGPVAARAATTTAASPAPTTPAAPAPAAASAPAPVPAAVATPTPVAGRSAATSAVTVAPLAPMPAPVASVPAANPTSPAGPPAAEADRKPALAAPAPLTATKVTLLGSVPVGTRVAAAPSPSPLPSPSPAPTPAPASPPPEVAPAAATGTPAAKSAPSAAAAASAGAAPAAPSLWSEIATTRSREALPADPLPGAAVPSEAQALCPVQSRAACAQALAALEAWRNDWRQRSIEAYGAHYANSYVAPGFKTRGQWLAYKKRVFEEAGFIDVSLKLLSVKKVGEHRFSISAEQRYSSAKYRDQTKKRFVLLMDAGQWRITSEQKDET